MCTGTSLLFRVPRVVVGENVNFRMDYAEKLMKDRGVKVMVVLTKGQRSWTDILLRICLGDSAAR